MPTESFTYSSQPHSAPTKRSSTHYKIVEDTNGIPLTMMSDPRVIRGNTHSLAKKIAKSHTGFSSSLNVKKRTNFVDKPDTQPRPTYSYEVKSFSTNEVDVSKYLIQQDDFPARTAECDNQTDEFNDRPRTPDYVPRKTGVDTSTQVEDVAELFDFDLEVVPIVEVIVQKVVEQALFELRSEHELECLEQAAVEYRAVGEQEAEWIRSKELAAIKESIATKVQIQALEVRKRNETETKALVAGLQMMRQTLEASLSAIIEENYLSGAWVTPETTMMRNEVLPALLSDVVARHEALSSAQETLDELLREAQDLYLASPQSSSDSGPEIALNVTFRSSSQTESNDDEEGAKEEVDNSVTLSFGIHPMDSVQSLERIIRNEIRRLKVVPTIEDGTEAPSADAVANSAIAAKLPGSSVPLHLHKRLSDLLLSLNGPPVRDIAEDALLVNFSWPDIITVEITF